MNKHGDESIRERWFDDERDAELFIDRLNEEAEEHFDVKEFES